MNSLLRLPRIVQIASLWLLMMVAGCATRPVDAPRFHSLTQRRGLGHLYYTGTKGEFHYFAESYILERTRRYRLPVSEYAIANTFPKTSGRSAWIPWQVSLSSNAEGFQGEQIHAIQK